MRYSRSILATLALCLFLNVAAMAQQAAPAAQGKSLYDRLGGINTVAAIVDEMANRFAVDTVFQQNPAIMASFGKLSFPALKYQVTSFVAQSIGGPEKYTGKTMKDTHASMKITEKEWVAMRADFAASLDKLSIKNPEREELIQFVEGLKPQIVAAGNPQK